MTLNLESYNDYQPIELDDSTLSLRDELISQPVSLNRNDSPSTATSFLPHIEFSNSQISATVETPEPSRETDEKRESNDKTEKQMAAEISTAVLSGDARQVSALMRAAAEKFAGDRTKISAMGEELGRLLSDKGFDVKTGTGTINIHKQGADNAVSFVLGEWTRAGLSKYQEQVYDWVTKADVATQPSSVMSDFGKTGVVGKGLKDGRELTNLTVAAEKDGDFTAAYRELARSALYVFGLEGMDGVKKLEADMRKGKTDAD
ncbi:MAG: hypothetical protein K2Z81_21415, partial [Cyanobacteria bacterium]|nr:hypothetical protein [Cyanobacteriota bacterium]